MKKKVKWWVAVESCEKTGEWEFDYDPSDEELKDCLEVEIGNQVVDSGWRRE